MLKIGLFTLGSTTLFQITKAQMWNLLEVILLVFWSSSFLNFFFLLAILQPATGKEAEDAQTVCIFMELFDF